MMMMRALVSLSMVLAVVSAFSTTSTTSSVRTAFVGRRGGSVVVPSTLSKISSSSSSLAMFSGDQPPPLKEDVKTGGSNVDNITAVDGVATNGDDGESSKGVYKNLARGGEVKQVAWSDPAMTANTNPFQMDWWAYIFVAFPVILFANDAFHFLPEEGPLAFLNNF